MNNKLFSERLRLLRESHSLSLNQLADILGKKKSAISDIEAGRIGTTLGTLSNIADLFAVSTDWLLGRTETPYSLEIIEKIEDELIVDKAGIYNHLEFFGFIKYYYRIKSDYYIEREIYSSEQRSNVIFALRFLIFAADKLFYLGYNPKVINITEGISFLEEHCSSKRTGTSFAKLCNQNIEILVQTLTR